MVSNKRSRRSQTAILRSRLLELFKPDELEIRLLQLLKNAPPGTDKAKKMLESMLPELIADNRRAVRQIACKLEDEHDKYAEQVVQMIRDRPLTREKLTAAALINIKAKKQGKPGGIARSRKYEEAKKYVLNEWKKNEALGKRKKTKNHFSKDVARSIRDKFHVNVTEKTIASWLPKTRSTT